MHTYTYANSPTRVNISHHVLKTNMHSKASSRERTGRTCPAQNLLQMALAEMAGESESPSARRVREKADSEMLGGWFSVALAPTRGVQHGRTIKN